MVVVLLITVQLTDLPMNILQVDKCIELLESTTATVTTIMICPQLLSKASVGYDFKLFDFKS